MKRRLYECDNCGRRHWGEMVKMGGGLDAVEWDFDWLNADGTRKTCRGCGERRDPCSPRDCWRCDWNARQAFR